MSGRTSLRVLGCLLLTAATAVAEIRPRWVTIGPGAPNQPAGVTTYVLLVDLSGNSLFAGASLQMTLSGSSTYYNQSPFGNDTTPNPVLVQIFPELGYDSHLSTTAGFAQLPAVVNLDWDPGAPPIFQHQTMRGAWSAQPPTGLANGQALEIARASVVGGEVPLLHGGLVFDQMNVVTTIPPIPEPAAGLAGLWLAGQLAVRRRPPRKHPGAAR